MITEADHVSNLSVPLRPLWESLRDRLAEYSGTSFAVKQRYISWKGANKVVCYIYFQRQRLLMRVIRGNNKGTGKESKKFFTIDDPKKIAEAKDWKGHPDGRRYEYLIELKNRANLDDVIFLLEQKHRSLA